MTRSIDDKVVDDVLASFEQAEEGDIDEAVTNYHTFMRKLIKAFIVPLEASIANLAITKGVRMDKTTTCVVPHGSHAFLARIDRDWTEDGRTLFVWSVAAGEEKTRMLVRGSVASRNGVDETMSAADTCDLRDIVVLSGLLHHHQPANRHVDARNPFARMMVADGGLPGLHTLEAEKQMSNRVTRITLDEVVALIDTMPDATKAFTVDTPNGGRAVLFDDGMNQVTITHPDFPTEFAAGILDRAEGRMLVLRQDDTPILTYDIATGVVDVMGSRMDVDVLDRVHAVSAHAKAHVETSFRPAPDRTLAPRP